MSLSQIFTIRREYKYVASACGPSVADVRLGARHAGVAGDAAAPVEAAATLGLLHAPHRAVPAPAAQRLAPVVA